MIIKQLLLCVFIILDNIYDLCVFNTFPCCRKGEMRSLTKDTDGNFRSLTFLVMIWVSFFNDSHLVSPFAFWLSDNEEEAANLSRSQLLYKSAWWKISCENCECFLCFADLNAKGCVHQAFEMYRLKSCVDFKPYEGEKTYIKFEKKGGYENSFLTHIYCSHKLWHQWFWWTQRCIQVQAWWRSFTEEH